MAAGTTATVTTSRQSGSQPLGAVQVSRERPHGWDRDRQTFAYPRSPGGTRPDRDQTWSVTVPAGATQGSDQLVANAPSRHNGRAA